MNEHASWNRTKTDLADRILVDETHALMDGDAFVLLPEYSCSIPTGKTLGKRWKRDDNAFKVPRKPPSWFMGEYVPDSEPGLVAIKWREIILINA